MALLDGDISGVRNKIVRGQLLAKMKREKAQTKLKKRIARKEAENRGEVVERGELQFLFSQQKHRIGLAWLVCVLQDLHLAPEMRVVYFERLMLTFFFFCDSLIFRMDSNNRQHEAMARRICRVLRSSNSTCQSGSRRSHRRCPSRSWNFSDSLPSSSTSRRRRTYSP